MRKEVANALILLAVVVLSGLFAGCTVGMTHVPSPSLRLEEPYTEYEGRLRVYRSDAGYNYYRMYMPDTGEWYACRKCRDVEPAMEGRCFRMYDFAFSQYKRDREKKGLPNLMRAGAGNRGPGGAVQCFAVGTYVLMADGSFRAIEEVGVNDMVLSVDPETGTEAPGRVSEVMQGAEQYLYLVNGNLRVNSAHKFYTDKGLKTAPEIAAGDVILGRDGERTEVASVTIETVALAAAEAVRPEITVHNLMVEDTHTFIVSPDKVDLYLVHDECSCAGD